jgi:ribosomal-protein-alanine N-acetyltransferase
MTEFNYSTLEPLETERLVLRQLLNSDLFQLYKIRSDESVNQFIDREIESDINETRDFIKKITELIQNNTSLYWAIVFRETNTLVGTICYWNFNYNKEDAEIGYELLPEYQGKGLMQEAIKRVINFGFEMLKLKSISAFVSEKNTKSIALLNKFQFEIVPNNLSDKTEGENLKEMIRFKLEAEYYRRNILNTL